MKTRGKVLGFVVLVLVLVLSSLAMGAEKADDGKLRIIVFGAHPDDCEIKAGGVGAMWAAKGHHVKFVSVCNGDLGHWKIAGGPLAKRRKKEVEEAAKILGIEQTQVLDIHDGELMPTLENRKIIIRLIRQWKADIVMAHRPNDYMADHRYVGVLVDDAAFMVTVPFLCPDVEHLSENPVFLYLRDGFRKPAPLEPDVVVAIDDVIEQKLEALSVIDSQFVEGGCCVGKDRQRIPKNKEELAAARKQVKKRFRRRFAGNAEKYRKRLIEVYGEEKGKKVQYAEVFELCEYGSRPSEAKLKKLFPFFGK